MSRTLSRVARLATAITAAATIATLGLAAPAQAHPEVVVRCESAPNSQHGCSVSIRFAVQPVQIRWYINGTHVTKLNDLISWFRGCARGEPVTSKAVVTDATGGSDSDSDTVICGTSPA
jgi:hypothetical protein